MHRAHILIVGAGASGLMSGYKLSAAGKKVTILEARERIGGRIYTCIDKEFLQPVELGAEFVHGQLPVTLKLLDDAGISYHNSAGEMWRYENRQLKKMEQFLPDFDLLLEKMNSLEEDCTLDEFLQMHFVEDRYDELRKMLRNFAAGYDTADAARFSIFAMREEMQTEDDGHQYRIEGGYIQMLSFLQKEIIKNGGEIRLSSEVKKIHWQKGSVMVVTGDEEQYNAEKIIITAPLNVLKNADAIDFIPAITKQQIAIDNMGMGAVIKIILQFDSLFWEEQAKKLGVTEDISEMGYLFSDQAIPTWWTQKPHHIPILTGWIGGPPAAALQLLSEGDILQLGLQSLGTIFSISADVLRERLTAHKVLNWTSAPFTQGSYSYATVATKDARKLLQAGIQETIFFAGEAVYDGPEMGTVEAALASGSAIAELLS